MSLGLFHASVDVFRPKLPIQNTLIFQRDDVPNWEVAEGTVLVLCLPFAIRFTMLSCHAGSFSNQADALRPARFHLGICFGGGFAVLNQGVKSSLELKPYYHEKGLKSSDFDVWR